MAKEKQNIMIRIVDDYVAQVPSRLRILEVDNFIVVYEIADKQGGTHPAEVSEQVKDLLGPRDRGDL
jgi:hypothetical protein